MRVERWFKCSNLPRVRVARAWKPKAKDLSWGSMHLHDKMLIKYNNVQICYIGHLNNLIYMFFYVISAHNTNNVFLKCF